MDKGCYLFTLPSGKTTGPSAPTLQLAGTLKSRGEWVVLLCLEGRLGREAQKMGLEVYSLSPLSLAKWGGKARAIFTSRSLDHFWALLLWGWRKPVFRLWFKSNPPARRSWEIFLSHLPGSFWPPSPSVWGGRGDGDGCLVGWMWGLSDLEKRPEEV